VIAFSALPGGHAAVAGADHGDDAGTHEDLEFAAQRVCPAAYSWTLDTTPSKRLTPWMRGFVPLPLTSRTSVRAGGRRHACLSSRPPT
jgi:hypothetical protein